MKTLIVALALLSATPATAAIYEFGPDEQLAKAIAGGEVGAGDTVRLSSGDYGMLDIDAMSYSPPLTIEAAPGATPRFSAIRIHQSAGIGLTGLTVRGGGSDDSLVTVNGSRNVILSRLDVASADNPSDWDAATWREKVRHGITIGGEAVTIRDSHIHIVRHAIRSDARGALVEGNLIENFTGDGIRALGNGSTYRGNTIRGCLKVDGNHDDGIQSWSRGPDGRPGTGVVRDVLIENNRILNSPPSFPVRNCPMQGIGLFDGMFERWTIRGNYVEVNHWHGITVMGGIDVSITGNTVIDADAAAKPGPPWIAITPHKDGRASSGSLIAENIIQRSPGRNKFLRHYPGVERRGDKIYVPPRPGATSP